MVHRGRRRSLVIKCGVSVHFRTHSTEFGEFLRHIRVGRSEQIPDALHEQTNASGHVSLTSGGIAEGVFASRNGNGDIINVYANVANVVFDAQHLRMGAVLFFRQLVLLPPQRGDLLAQSVSNSNDSLAEGGDGRVEEFASDGEQFFDALGEQLRKDNVCAPARPGSDSNLD